LPADTGFGNGYLVADARPHGRNILEGNNKNTMIGVSELKNFPWSWLVGRNATMKSKIAKRSLIVRGHRSSVSLEVIFWADLRKIARIRRCSLSNLVAEIDSGREGGNLSSAIRLFVLEHFRAKSNSTLPDGRPTSNLIGGDGGSDLRGPLEMG
jgi:predicted DNA-binding ribbon-helix-helix protein